MSEVVLQPILHHDVYTRLVEQEILAWMREAIFMPLLIVMHDHGVAMPTKFQAVQFDETGVRENAAAEVASALEKALRSGQVIYSNGSFSGTFNAGISRELHRLGASFDAEAKVFNLALDRLPFSVRGAIAESSIKAKALHDEVLRLLGIIGGNVAAAKAGLNFTGAVDVISKDLAKQFTKTVTDAGPVEFGGVHATASIPAELTEAQRKELTERLTNNIELSIKDFEVKRIPELRKRVEENLFAGGRSTKLAEILESEFGVDQRKAAFLADQETGMLVSKFREIKYASVGVQEYVWSTSGDSRVRPDHRALNGRRFFFSSPPVTDRATGRRNNPGEDFRCRCVAKPVISFANAK